MILRKIIILAILMHLPFTNFAQQSVKLEKNYIEVCFSNKLNIHEINYHRISCNER
jgi:hypothetical protein